MVVRQFEQQLLREADLEDRHLTESLRDDFDKRVSLLEAEKSAQVSDVDKLLRQVNDQIDFLRVVAGELESKKSELASMGQASVQ